MPVDGSLCDTSASADVVDATKKLNLFLAQQKTLKSSDDIQTGAHEGKMWEF